MEITVRPIGPDDADVVGALVTEAGAELAAQRGGPTFLTSDAWQLVLRAPAPDPAEVALVAEVDGTPVGFAVAVDRTGIAVVLQLWVDPGVRDVGVGEAILDELIAWATARGCTGIDAYALPGARETKSFFETAGLKARLLIVHRSLPRTDG